MQPLWKTEWRFLKKLKIELPHDPAIPLLEKMKTLVRKANMYPNVHSSTIYNSQDMETTPNAYQQIWKDVIYVIEIYIYIYNGILLSHKKEWNTAICSNMDRPREYHTKWSKSDRERQIVYDVTYMWNLKNNTNENETDSQT